MKSCSTIFSNFPLPFVLLINVSQLFAWRPFVIYIKTIRRMMKIITTMTSLTIMMVARVDVIIVIMVVIKMMIIVMSTVVLTSIFTLRLVPTIQAIWKQLHVWGKYQQKINALFIFFVQRNQYKTSINIIFRTQ